MFVFLKSWRKCQNYIMHIMEFLFLNVTFTFCYNQGSFFYFLFYLRRDQLTPLTSVSYSPLYWSLVATTRASLILIFLFFLLFFFGGDCICFLIVETWPFGVLFKIPLSANTRLIFDCAFIYLHLFSCNFFGGYNLNVNKSELRWDFYTKNSRCSFSGIHSTVKET